MADDDELAEARVGKVVDGRYKITELMAAGSMGSVYRAERVPVGKLVAIKFLHASYADDREFQARFERETRVMSKLAHPNCVSVLDFGVFEGAPYLVMDFVAGTTLRARIDKGPIAAPQALALARQIAAGLAHAHEQGIIHRDIKPANVMITDEIGTGERVRILDFGLARLRGNVGRDATQTNMVVGTPNYMAPEQTVGGALIDARTDIYAVGVVLFEMVVGDRPFHAEDTLQLLGMHRAAPIPRLADRAREGTDIPPGLQELIDKAMAKVPSDRFQTAIDLAAAIDDVMLGNVAVPEERDATLPRSGPVVMSRLARRTGTTATAPTLAQFDSSMQEADDDERVTRRGGFSWFALLLLFGGVAAMAMYLIKREKSAPSPVVKISDAAVKKSIDAPREIDAARPIDAALDAPADAAPDAPADASPDAPPEEVAMDPTTAEDIDPQKGSANTAVEEAENAPKTREEVEQKAPQPPPEQAPQLATNLKDAMKLIKEGKRELALKSLIALEKKQPWSANIPFVLGNLYYDQTWWGVALEEYALAVKKGSAYRNNPTLIRNVIRMLSSNKTQAKAANFLRGTIGHPARAYLLQAAKYDGNPIIKKRAAELARYIR